MPTRVPENLLRRLMILSRILAFFGLSSCAMPPAPGESEKLDAISKKDVVSVLFIGNSYSFGIPKAFEKEAAANGKNVKTGHATYGGWSLARHSKNEPTLRKLRGRRWDIVVIQDYSLHPSQGKRERALTMDPAVRFFVSEARSLGAVPLLYQTWGRRDGDPEVEGDDFFKMNDRVRHGYQAAARSAGGVRIVPVGNAWEEEYKAGRGHELFVEDGSHPSDYGNLITAQEFYRVIFEES